MTWRAIFGWLYGEAKAYIPKSRFPSGLGAMTKGNVIQMIREIGQTKMILESAGENTEMLPEFLYGRGLHSCTSELNLSNSRTRSRAKSGNTVDRRAQVELNWERV